MTLPILTASLLVPAAVAGQAPRDTTRTDTTVFRLERLLAGMVRPVITAGGVSAIELNDASLRLPAAPTTEEVLREIPTLHVRTNTRGEAEIAVRGSESRQVAVLLDGVPLTLGWDGRTDVSVFGAGAVENIRFVRGISSVLHGPNVLGGVVEMSTAARLLPRRASFSASGTLDGEGGFAASVHGEQPFDTDGGAGVVRIGAGWRDRPGFPLPKGVTEPVATDGLRLNTDATNLSGFFSLRYDRDRHGWASLSASGFRGERGIAAELGAAQPRLWRYPAIERLVVAASGGTGHHDTPWGRADLEASVGMDVGHSSIRSYRTRDYDDIVGREDGNDRTVTTRLLGDHTLGRRGNLAAAFTLADIDHEAIVDGQSAGYRQRLMSVAGESTWILVETPSASLATLRLSLGGAWDRGWTPRTGNLPATGTLDDWGARAGVSAILAGGTTLIHAGVSRRGRFPALREMYSEALDRFVPSPDLRPEQLVAVEGGVTTRVGAGELQLVGFHYDLSGAIRRITLDDGRRMRVNSDELVSTGIEVLFNQSFGTVSFGGDLTLQTTRLEDPSTSVSSRPENLPGRAARGWVAFPIAAGFTGAGEAEFTGPQFCQDPDSGADVKLAGGTWLNATLSRIWSFGSARRLETSASADNLADSALYDQCGLPRPGRMLSVSVRVFLRCTSAVVGDGCWFTVRELSDASLSTPQRFRRLRTHGAQRRYQRGQGAGHEQSECDDGEIGRVRLIDPVQQRPQCAACQHGRGQPDRDTDRAE
jgi:iron complex outermembrane receptor protein